MKKNLSCIQQTAHVASQVKGFFLIRKRKETKKKKMRKSKRKTMEIKKRIGGGTSAAWKVLYQAGE
jgi:hypothetical protein